MDIKNNYGIKNSVKRINNFWEYNIFLLYLRLNWDMFLYNFNIIIV